MERTSDLDRGRNALILAICLAIGIAAVGAPVSALADQRFVRLGIPNNSKLVGLKAYTVFLVEDPKARSGLSMISNTVVVEIRS